MRFIILRGIARFRCGRKKRQNNRGVSNFWNATVYTPRSSIIVVAVDQHIFSIICKMKFFIACAISSIS